MLAALALAPAQAAPLSREDSAPADTGTSATDDNTDSASAGALVVSPGTPVLANPTAPAMAGIATAAASAKAASAPVAQDRDFGRSIREVSRPMLDELAHSDVAEAVRALDNNKPGSVDAGLDDRGQVEESDDPAARRRNWDGSGQRQARENNAQPQGASRDPERDKARAALLLSGLINEIKPWALGAAVLYVLAYIAKFSLAARRRTVQRRMERHKYRTRNSQSSQHGRP